jgi:hypothetical protein
MRKEIEWFGLLEKEDDPFVLVITPWSMVHFLSGSAAKQLGMSFKWFWLLHLGYEVKDQIKRETGEVYNSFVNSVGDQMIGTLGHILTPQNSSGGRPFIYMFMGSLLLAYLSEDVLGEFIG